jgi:hypothetical protein
MNYFDTSALTKRFVEGAGSKRVAPVLAGKPTVATSKLVIRKSCGARGKAPQEGVHGTAYRTISRNLDPDWCA